ncbi:MAG: MATE family efflux transporter, partial [Bacilli bacterium]
MKQFNLTKGPILKNILFIAWPLILTNVINMMYNVTDMFWVSKLGSGGVAAVGSAGLYLWLANSFIIIVKLGSEVMVGQSVGNKSDRDIRKYAVTGLVMAIFLVALFVVALFIFNEPLINVFGLQEKIVA